jgi:hypothetical protein
MAVHARQCIEALDKQRQDITMLWLLKEPDWLERCKAGRELKDWALNIMGVPTALSRGEAFQAEVRAEFRKRGIRKVAPSRVVDDWKKDRAKELCLEARWPKPCFPVMLQTRPSTDGGTGAFAVFSSWQDALFAQVAASQRLEFKGKDRSYAANMLYENQLVDMGGYDLPCRLILDCDAKQTDFGGRFSVEELGRRIDEVPAWFVKRLAEIGAIKATDEVVVYEKEKSREGKASRHYIFNIMGFSTWDTQAVLREIFATELEKEREAERKAQEKGQKRLEDADLPIWKMVDPVPHHGRGQYSTLGFFDQRKKETEFPSISRRLVIVNGRVTSMKSCKVARKDSGLDNPLALDMLHKTSYTSFVENFITLDPKFMTQRATVSIAQLYCPP